MRPSRVLVYLFALLTLIAVVVLAARPASGGPDGKTVFLDKKCNLCHSVEAAGIQRTSKSEKTKGPDLAGVAKKHDAEWIKRWVNKQEELNGKKHMAPFKGTPEELDALVAWLRTQ